MKYAFAAAALVAGAVAAPEWHPEGYGWESTTSCSEEQTWTTTPVAPEYTHQAPPQYQTWATSSSVWVESSSAPAPTPYHSASSSWVESTSSAWVHSSSSWVESSSAPAPTPYHSASSSWVESSSVWAPVSSSSVWVHSSSAPAPSGYAPHGTGVAPSGYAPHGTAAPSGTVGTIRPSSPTSAPSPTGSPITPYQGAANALNAAGLLAGVGAIAALFL